MLLNDFFLQVFKQEKSFSTLSLQWLLFHRYPTPIGKCTHRVYTLYDCTFVIAMITLSSLHPPLVWLLIHYAIHAASYYDIVMLWHCNVIVMGFLSIITSTNIINIMPEYIDIHGSQLQYQYVMIYTPATVLSYMQYLPLSSSLILSNALGYVPLITWSKLLA